MLDLDDAQFECARLAVKAALRGETEDTLKSWHLDAALRHCAQDREAGVQDDTLAQALLVLYLEIEGIDSETAVTAMSATSGTSLQRLDALEFQDTISFKVSRRVYFSFITKTCDPSVRELVPKHHYHLSDAIRGGLETLVISRPQAQIAEFCLLTDLDPIEARSYGADTDLVRAVADALATRVIRMHQRVKVLQAKLFPARSSAEDIQRALLWGPGHKTEPDYERASKEYMVSFFSQETMCRREDDARSYLEASTWTMENAIKTYRANALAPSPSDDIDISNPASSTLDGEAIYLAIETLIINYNTSLPTQLPSDYGLQDQIRRFKSNDLTTKALQSLHDQLTYRHHSCSLAMQIAKKFGLWKAAATPIWEWDPHQSLDRGRFLKVVGLLQRNIAWFRPAKKGDGMPYTKPVWYLANALMMQGIEQEKEVSEWIEKAKEILRIEFEAGSEEVEGEHDEDQLLP